MIAQAARLLVYLVAILALTKADPLFLRAPSRDRSQKLKFGQSSCITNDGRRIAIGANGYDKFRGALYVYDLATDTGDRLDHWRRTRIIGNDTRSAEDKQPRELRVVERGSGFGFSCAITPDGEHLLIGAPGHSLQRGAVFLFSYNRRARSWTETDRFNVPDLKSGDLFGWAVVVSELCDIVVVSAKGKRANNGEVYVFNCDEACLNCEIASRLTPMDYTDTAGPRGIRIRNNFGISVAMNREASIMAVGCIGFNEERGTVYMYARQSDKRWKMIQKLDSPNAQQFGFFGYKLSLDSDGMTLAVGADGEEQYKGAVYMFRKQSADMEAGDFEYVQEVGGTKTKAEDNFGGAVALSGDGKALLVGAPGRKSQGKKDHGVTYVFRRRHCGESCIWELVDMLELPKSHSKEESFFGWNVGVSSDGGRFVATAPNSYNGGGLAAFGMVEMRGEEDMGAGSVETDNVSTMVKQDL